MATSASSAEPLYTHGMGRDWPIDRYADVGGRRLRYWAAGEGTPSILLECGLGTSVVDWAALLPSLATRGRVLGYDRAGLGGSDPDQAVRSAGRMVDDLDTLIDAAAMPPPYILVGHSWGGLVARLFCHRHPADVAGLVLVDPAHEEQFTSTMLALNRISYSALYALGRLRLLPKLLRRMPPVTLYDDRVRTAVLEQGARPATVRTAWWEVAGIRPSLHELAAAKSASGLLDVPVVVLSAGGHRQRGPVARALTRVHRLHASLVDEERGGYHQVVDGSSHFVHLEQPELVLAAVDHLLGISQQR